MTLPMGFSLGKWTCCLQRLTIEVESLGTAIVITMPEVHEAKLAVLICRDAPNRPRLRPAVLFDVDSCIPKWVAIRIDDRPCNYTRLTGIVRHLRACK